MELKNKDIKIIDWAGNVLFSGPFDSPQAGAVLDANRCDCRNEIELVHEMEICEKCDSTGYIGDFYIVWESIENENLNVYEYIEY